MLPAGRNNSPGGWDRLWYSPLPNCGTQKGCLMSFKKMILNVVNDYTNKNGMAPSSIKVSQDVLEGYESELEVRIRVIPSHDNESMQYQKLVVHNEIPLIWSDEFPSGTIKCQ